MTLVEATQQLRLLTQASTDPQLTDGELEQLLSMNQLEDSVGNAPASSDWIPTYDFNRAAQMGWEAKAGKSSDHHQISVGDRNQSAQQVHQHCMEMAAMYRRKRAGSITTRNVTSTSRQSC